MIAVCMLPDCLPGTGSWEGRKRRVFWSVKGVQGEKGVICSFIYWCISLMETSYWSQCCPWYTSFLCFEALVQSFGYLPCAHISILSQIGVFYQRFWLHFCFLALRSCIQWSRFGISLRHNIPLEPSTQSLVTCYREPRWLPCLKF